ncbi:MULTISPECIES: SDR family NAD(P)-dependent oxidoreductase [Mycobacterium]|uniref:3-oxoacyl-[acyl-carrier-protein] reductase MabA n=1 Tax=Mycobacterium indicus pranii (strain DSM 45239 / MTCC 9506) TaxID=1232724 RepID=J9W8Z6_MYCIP|nr:MULTISPECIES: SDR family NAD(P)-dependent oxidoreductase [Mycobacterium]AFS13425.1 2-hydroxy cyclohexane carboxyl-CoA dehydrogenase [Mycobacterium intracellulare subsp. intracellulare MTCC 9506]WSE50231.1 SDR family NAD(P)-dependent oxidoreductase [Mycobacterium sp. 2-64]BCO50998.1 short-chain dehydrogenase [Mycobacterium paraintracellulare]BCO88182.1 short-chain dehydrogenase [Mycobacterium paraintracellulare]
MSRVAVITGGASGIGAAISGRLARRGHKVALFDQAGDTLKQQVDALQNNGSDARGYEVDVTDRAAVIAAVNAVRADLGPVHIAVTSAGITSYAPFTDLSIEQWNRTLAINLTGTFNSVQAVIPDMIAAGWGRVVTISSAAGQAAAPGQADYVASKGAVIALTRALAAEFAGNGITVNTIPPALVDTPMARAAEADGTLPASLDDIGAMLPLKRVGTSDDIAAACEFLCSEDASYITGQQINVNGGIYM